MSDKIKKIIFVGGTSRSGSTLLDLILSNDEKAMSLGEIASLFHPTRKHHFLEIKKLKQIDRWNSIISGGKKNLYPNLIKHFPEIDIFVDSSKNPFWFKYQMNLDRKEYIIRNVLMHKSPFELANSYIKRGRVTEWISAYIRYHRKYISLIDEFVSVSYKKLIVEESYLEELCQLLNINYYKGKKNYWDKNHRNFFGSYVVRGYDAKKDPGKRTRKDLKYDGINKDYFDYVEGKINENIQISLIEKEILKRDIFKKTKFSINKRIKYSRSK